MSEETFVRVAVGGVLATSALQFVEAWLLPGSVPYTVVWIMKWVALGFGLLGLAALAVKRFRERDVSASDQE